MIGLPHQQTTPATVTLALLDCHYLLLPRCYHRAEYDTDDKPKVLQVCIRTITQRTEEGTGKEELKL